MKITNVVICKEDTEVKTMGINECDTAAPDESVDVNVDYNSLDAGQQATVDAFYALAETFIPA